MASFLTTMSVHIKTSPTAKALPPHCTLKQSSSCVTLNTFTFSEDSTAPHSSPIARATKLLQEELKVHSKADLVSCSNARTRGQFKPRQANKGTSSYQLRQFAEATLGSGSLRKAVKLPEGEDLNEWLAVNGKTARQRRRAAEKKKGDTDEARQWSTSTTRSTCYMAPSPSSVPPKHAPR